MDWLSPHVPLELENLGQGQVIKHVREALAKAQQEVVAFLRKHGDAAKGAHATVTLSLKFKIDNPAEAHVKILHSLKATPPTLPPGETSGFVENDGKGNKLMVVQGTTVPLDAKQQLSLFAGGVQFDPGTGEILGPSAANGIDLRVPSASEPMTVPFDEPAQPYGPMGA